MPPSGAINLKQRLFSPSLTKPLVNFPGLSLTTQTNMYGQGGGQNFDSYLIGRTKEHEYENRSSSDNMDGGSSDDQDGDKPPSKKRYNRHTPQQIQEFEALFEECQHPDKKQRMELSKKISLEGRQIKSWFQNRRAHIKTQLERHENFMLKQENDKLRSENMSLRDAMKNPVCNNCGGLAMLGNVSLEEQLENARLKDELDRLCALAVKFLGWNSIHHHTKRF